MHCCFCCYCLFWFFGLKQPVFPGGNLAWAGCILEILVDLDGLYFVKISHSIPEISLACFLCREMFFVIFAPPAALYLLGMF